MAEKSTARKRADMSELRCRLMKNQPYNDAETEEARKEKDPEAQKHRDFFHNHDYVETQISLGHQKLKFLCNLGVQIADSAFWKVFFVKLPLCWWPLVPALLFIAMLAITTILLQVFRVSTVILDRPPAIRWWITWNLILFCTYCVVSALIGFVWFVARSLLPHTRTRMFVDHIYYDLGIVVTCALMAVPTVFVLSEREIDGDYSAVNFTWKCLYTCGVAWAIHAFLRGFFSLMVFKVEMSLFWSQAVALFNQEASFFLLLKVSHPGLTSRAIKLITDTVPIVAPFIDKANGALEVFSRLRSLTSDSGSMGSGLANLLKPPRDPAKVRTFYADLVLQVFESIYKTCEVDESERLDKRGARYVTRGDLSKILSDEQVTHCMMAFTGSPFAKRMWAREVEKVLKDFRERQENVIEMLDGGNSVGFVFYVIFEIIFWIIALIIILIVFGLNLDSFVLLTSITGFFLGFSFIFGGMVSRLFTGIVFLAFKHPFVIGDRVNIPSVAPGPLIISRVGIVTCEAYSPDGRHWYMSTLNLMDSVITQLTTTKDYGVEVGFNCLTTTTDEQLEKLRDYLQVFFEVDEAPWDCASKDWVYFVTRIENNQKVFVTIYIALLGVTHSTPFRYASPTDRLWKFLRSACAEIGIVYEGPPQKIIMAGKDGTPLDDEHRSSDSSSSADTSDSDSSSSSSSSSANPNADMIK